MARGIKFKDFVYDIDDCDETSPIVISSCFVRLDAFNVGTAKGQLVASGNKSPFLKAHILEHLNQRKFGIHPRTLVCERIMKTDGSDCYGTEIKRIVRVVVPTLDQFLKFKKYDKTKTTAQADAQITINHSFNGSKKSEYRIVKKLRQFMV